MKYRSPMKAKQTYRKKETDKKTVEEQKCAHTNLGLQLPNIQWNQN